MADNSLIEWCDATWNPITGCSVCSPGCAGCYAMKLAGTRMKHHWSRKGLTNSSKAGPVWNGQVRFNAEWLDQPMHWSKPRRIFVNAHGDTFHENVPDEWIDKVFAVMALSPQHSFQVLTKRSKRMRAYFADPKVVRRIYEIACDMVIEQELQVVLIAPGFDEAQAPAGRRVYLDQWPLRNVWLGISCEDQQRADERIPDLLETPAAVRFISAEPLLGPISLHPLGDSINALSSGVGPNLDWVIVGGESGDKARPMHPDWARSLRDQCEAAKVAFHFKQWGEWMPDNSLSSEAMESLELENKYENFGGWGFARVGKKHAGRQLDGRTWDGMPA